MAGDIFTLDSDNNAAVRTVSVNAGASETNSPVIFTTDENGNAAVRVVGAAGGEVDYSRLIIKSSTIPTAGSDEYRKVYMYVGETDANYTHGYIYECQKTAITYTGTVSFEAATLSGTTVACSGDDFAQFLTEAGADPTPIVSGTLTYDAGAAGWRLVGKDAEDNTVTNFLEYNEDYADAGFTFTGTPVDGDVIAFTCTVEEDTVTYGWVRIDVQPAPEALPDQTGQSGKFLTTNGSAASWGSVESLPSQTGQSGKFLTTDGTDASWGTINALQNASSAQYSLVIDGIANSDTRVTAIGYNATGETSCTVVGAYAACSKANGTAIGFSAKIYAPSGDNPNVVVGEGATAGESSTYTVQSCVVVGANSKINRNSSNSVAVGRMIYVSADKSVAIGAFAEISSSASKGIAIGYNTQSKATGAIQLGTTGNPTTNSDANTFKIANANGNFEIMSADGTIPAARHASLPVADGTYVLKLTISGGVPTLAWVAE